MMTDDAKVSLVTGVAGFIGSHLAERLLQEGHRVIGVDGFIGYYPSSMKKRNIASLLRRDRFSFIEADLLDLDLVALLRVKPTAKHQLWTSQGKGQELPAHCHHVGYVFHLAAQPGVRASWGTNFEVYTRNNVLVTQRLLEAAKDVPLKKFVYSSSSSVYGNAETFPISETVMPQPVSPYGVTKLAAEHLCLLYWRNYGLPAVCLRYFSVYGPRQRPDMAFYRFIRAMLEEQEIVVYGDGEQTRDFTYVDDVVDATARAGIADFAGEVFNIGGGSRVTVNETIKVLEHILGRRARVRCVESQSGDVRHTAADITRVTTVLGFRPQTSLADGLQAEVQWLDGDLHGTG